MKRNMGLVDRMVRVVAAAVAVWLAAVVGMATAGGIILLAVALLLTATALVGSCPLYTVLKLSTRRPPAPH